MVACILAVGYVKLKFVFVCFAVAPFCIVCLLRPDLCTARKEKYSEMYIARLWLLLQCGRMDDATL